MILPRILALILFATVGIASFADAPTSDADKLVAQLGSGKFAEREAALKASKRWGRPRCRHSSGGPTLRILKFASGSPS